MQIKTTPNGRFWLLSKYWKGVWLLVTQLKTISLVRAKGGAYVWKMQSKDKVFACFPHHLLGKHIYSPMNSFPRPPHKIDFPAAFLSVTEFHP